MRICIVCYPTYGGSGVVATEVGLALAARGHEVHFVSYAPPRRLPGFHARVHYHEVRTPNYPLFRWPPYDLALASELVEIGTAVDLDIIHAHYALPHAIGAYLARQILAGEGRQVATVTTLHGTDITLVGIDPSYLHATRFGIARSNAVTAVSHWLRDETVRFFGTSDPITVIPNFVDADRFAPERYSEEVRRTFAPDGERLLIHVSNLRPVKRLDQAVQALARVHREVPSVLLVVGEGPERARAEATAQAEGVSEQVRFLGDQDGVEVLLASSDLYVLPSTFESFGVSALEAMACGVPVVGARGGGLPELVVDDVTGKLFSAADVEAMADACLDILTEPDRAQAMGQAGRQRVLEHYTEAAVLPRYLEVYERVRS
jgi:N-acetyl-alpha-D-glucosaminyl L-malate synthase BshA